MMLKELYFQLHPRLTLFCDPCLTSVTKRAELASLRTTALFTFLELNGSPQNRIGLGFH